MRRIFVRAIFPAVLVGLAALAWAQQEMPKPGPELKKIGYLAGNWKTEGDMKAGPMGPGGKFSGTDAWEWMEGNFFLVDHAKYTGPGIASSATAFMGYDADKKVYTYDQFDSMGETVHATGTVEGNTWTWLNEMKVGNQMMKGRYTTVILSPTSYSFKFEVSHDGATWNLVQEGKATKL